MHYERKNDFKITRALLEDVRVSARVSIEKDLEESATDTQQQYKIIFDAFSRTRLNGYLTKSPEGKTARSVELSGFVGLSTKEIQTVIASAITAHFPHLRPTFVPAPFAYYKAVEQIVTVPHDYLFFDIRSELTDVLVVRDEELAYSGSFPFGIKSALRLLSKDIVDASHRLDLYYSKRLSDDEEMSVRKSLANIQEEWDTYLEDFTRNASLYGALPSTLLYASEIGSELFIKDLVLKKFGPSKNMHRIAVHVFDLPLKGEVEVLTPTIFDPFLVLSSLYLESQAKM
jgi:hypothetical protein